MRDSGTETKKIQVILEAETRVSRLFDATGRCRCATHERYANRLSRKT